jgi:hypothetical protein
VRHGGSSIRIPGGRGPAGPREGKPIAQVARDLGIVPETLENRSIRRAAPRLLGAVRTIEDMTRGIARCKYRNLAEPGPERQTGLVYSADFFEDRWRRYPYPSLSRGLLAGGGVRVVSVVARREGGVQCRPD